MLARDEQSVSSLDSFKNPETGAAAKKIVKLAEDKMKGVFTPSREKDEFSIDLGNPKHRGRVRGKGKLVVWKKGWEEDQDQYKKRRRDKEPDISLKVKELVDMAPAKRGIPPPPTLDEPLPSFFRF
jgi:hypothetical protein